jgi:ribokinase
MSKIAVIGSINMDLVTQVSCFPRSGETVIARGFSQFPGGKGANQAAACGRLGADVRMYGLVGNDPFAGNLIASLKESHVQVESIQRQTHASSGVAIILVNAEGENMIAIASGANGRVDRDYLDPVMPQIRRAAFLLLQLEIPFEAIGYLLDQLPSDRPLVILDPAPARNLEGLPTKRIAIITPNESELASLTAINASSECAIERAAEALRRETGIETVICKGGVRGAYLSTSQVFQRFPAYAIDAVDTTAAGDAFNAGLAVALSEEKPLTEAIRYANAVAALSVTRRGAQVSMPWQVEVERFLETQGALR